MTVGPSNVSRSDGVIFIGSFDVREAKTFAYGQQTTSARSSPNLAWGVASQVAQAGHPRLLRRAGPDQRRRCTMLSDSLG